MNCGNKHSYPSVVVVDIGRALRLFSWQVYGKVPESARFWTNSTACFTSIGVHKTASCQLQSKSKMMEVILRMSISAIAE